MGFVAAEVAFEQLTFGAGEVHDDQAIEDVGKFRVDVKTQQLAAEAEVLSQEDRYAGVVGFDLGDHLGEFIEIAASGEGGVLRRAVAGAHQMSPLLELSRAFEEGDHQLAR